MAQKLLNSDLAELIAKMKLAQQYVMTRYRQNSAWRLALSSGHQTFVSPTVYKRTTRSRCSWRLTPWQLMPKTFWMSSTRRDSRPSTRPAHFSPEFSLGHMKPRIRGFKHYVGYLWWRHGRFNGLKQSSPTSFYSGDNFLAKSFPLNLLFNWCIQRNVLFCWKRLCPTF